MTTTARLHQCNSTKELIEFVSDLDMHVKTYGGRNFVLRSLKTSDHSNNVTLNEIVEQLRRIYILESRTQDQKAVKPTKELGVRLWYLEKRSSEDVTRLSIFKRILTCVHQFFGNLFYNRNVVLKNVKMEEKAAQLGLSMKAKAEPKQEAPLLPTIP